MIHYNKVVLRPNKCVVNSRSECDTSIDFCGYKFAAPIVPANMESVINADIAKWLAFNKYFYIMHRFGDTRKFIQRARAESWPLVSISVGIKEDDEVLINDIAESKCRVDFVTIDIAHGFSDSVAEMIKHIKNNLPNTKVIAGNIFGDEASIKFLENAGADAIKVGLSCGAGCTTFNETGFGSPMFSAAISAGKWAKVPVILDGGARENGDIAKAMVGFFSEFQNEMYSTGLFQFEYEKKKNPPMIMAGSIFAACVDAPGENLIQRRRTKKCEQAWAEYDEREKRLPVGHMVYLIPPEEEYEDIVTHKKYYGSASAESKKKTGQAVKHVEGKSVEIPCNGLTYAEKYEQIIGAIQSQISYAGGKNLLDFSSVKYYIT